MRIYKVFYAIWCFTTPLPLAWITFIVSESCGICWQSSTRCPVPIPTVHWRPFYPGVRAYQITCAYTNHSCLIEHVSDESGSLETMLHWPMHPLAPAAASTPSPVAALYLRSWLP